MVAPANLPQWVAAHYQIPIYRVLVNGASALRVLSIGVELGYDQQSAAASLSIASPTLPAWQPGQRVEIALGYGGTGGGLQPVFQGEIEDVDLAYFPHHVALAAAGYLRRTQPRYPDELSWTSIEDGALWVELLRKSGVPRYQTSNQGEGIVYGTRAPVVLRAGEAMRELIDRLDQSSPTGMRTYEIGGIVFRSAVLGVPAGNPSYHYAQGDTSYPVGRVLAVDRTDTIRDVANHCTVTGLPQTDGTGVFAERRATSPYVPRDADGGERFQSYDFSSDLLETRAQCDLVSQRYLIERNKRTDQISLRAPLNPYVVPGRTVGLRAEKLGLQSERPFWIRHVRHSFDAGGAWTEMDLEGGAGETGYLVGLDPIAAFTYTVSSEVFLVAGVPTRMYTAVCDGSTSFDPDGVIVSYAWSTSIGASGTGVVFTVGFTEAQWNAGPSVTLTVTDGDTDPTGPHQGSFTDTLSGDGGALLTRTLYVAAAARADCTPDGGATWGSFTPVAGVTVRSTPEIAPLDHSYVGLSNGQLYRSSDGLATVPELVHTFPTSVECIWVNEANAVRVWCGLADGHVWYTAQADLGATAVWIDAVTLPDPVNWLVESYLASGQVRACSGTNVYLTFDAFATYGVVSALPNGTCKRLALSFFGNYESGASSSPVVKEDRTPVGFPGTPPADARITAFAAEDALLCVDETGQSWISRGGATFAAAGSTGYGACGHVVRDGEQTRVFYAACAEGLAKSYDGALTWLPLRDYAGASLIGLQVGYAAAPLSPPRRILMLERTSVVPTSAVAPIGNGTPKVSLLTNAGAPGGQDTPPAGWQTVAFDDTVPWTGAGGASHAWSGLDHGIVGGGGSRFFRAFDSWAPGANSGLATEQAIFRHAFLVPDPGEDGPWATALLETFNLVSLTGSTVDEGVPMEVYLNGHPIAPGPTGNIYVDPALLVADGATTNLIAVRAIANVSAVAGHRAAWKLTVSTDTTVVSLATGPDGALYWRPTGECECRFWASAAAIPADWNRAADPTELQTVARRTFDNASDDPPTTPVFGAVAAPGAADRGVLIEATPYMTHRHATKLPASSSGGPYRSVHLSIRAPEGNPGLAQTTDLVQINGVTLDASTSGEYDLDPAVLVPGGWNVFCARSRPGPTAVLGYAGWLSYLVRIEP